MPRTRRLPATLGLLAAVALTLISCSPTPPETETDTTASIVIDHAYGTLELAEAPESVVTLGLLETDVTVALGVAPVAMAKFFATPDGIAPWLEPALDDRPQILDTTTVGANGAELDVERIAALEPDLIVATTYTQLDKYYDQLSAIAPVLGPADSNYLRLPWRDQTMAIADALGRSDQGAALVDDIDQRLTDAAAEFSRTAGHDYTLSLGTPDQIKMMNDPSDASVEIMNAFGLEFSTTASALPGLNDGSGSTGVSEENIAAIDADIVMIGYFGDGIQAAWEESKLFQQLSAVRNGGYIPMNLAESTALRNPSPLSIPYVIDTLVAGKIAPVLAQ